MSREPKMIDGAWVLANPGEAARRINDNTGRIDEALADAAFVARSRCESLAAALRAVLEVKPEPFAFPADWQQQIAACPECERWRGHPIQQGICDTHRKPLYAREAHDRHEQECLIYKAQGIARAALTQLEEPK